jgi:hypothetical protein
MRGGGERRGWRERRRERRERRGWSERRWERMRDWSERMRGWRERRMSWKERRRWRVSPPSTHCPG